MRDWRYLRAALKSGHISRRDFIKKATALGLASSVLTKTAGADDETPKRGGNLVLGINGAASSDTLNPATWTATYPAVLGLQLYNTLVEINVGDDLRSKPTAYPALAESWDTKPGAKEWIFKLRKGVTFHNGKMLTPADVVYSINHHRGSDSTSGAKPLLSSVVDVKAAGKNEIIFTLDNGNADLPYLLADVHLCIVPEGSKFTDGVGTGAYLLETFTPGVRAITKRNPNHFRSDRGFVDSVETLGINDPTARIEALLSGAVQLINRVDVKAVTEKVQLFEISGGAHYTFPMRCDMAPFDNKDLRLALKYAVDRTTMVKTILFGHGTIANDQPIPQHDEFYSGQIPQRPYDPEKAKFHYKKSRHSGPIALTVSDGAFTGAVNCAQLLQESAAKTGIKLEIEHAPADGYWSNIWMKRPFCASYWEGRPTADLMLSVAYKSDAVWNESFWKRADFDKILLAARVELNRAKRKQMYQDLQSMVQDDSGEIIPMFHNTIDAGSKKLRGFIASPASEMSGYRAAEMVWFA
ncbi:MAG: ABC transporter substrate-binding protein [Gammaproteobacteria bacterium]|nr:ABC transporter substrate-binding protein [Gammaproteobacteria bacterium]